MGQATASVMYVPFLTVPGFVMLVAGWLVYALIGSDKSGWRLAAVIVMTLGLLVGAGGVPILKGSFVLFCALWVLALLLLPLGLRSKTVWVILAVAAVLLVITALRLLNALDVTSGFGQFYMAFVEWIDGAWKFVFHQ